MKQAVVSIITPTYNHEHYIAQCIDSVVCQSFAAWELLIIDDGSTDKTVQIAKNYAINDQRIRVLTQQHLGAENLFQTYNKALDCASGEWIAILEGDDYWLPDKLETQIQHLTPSTIICYSMYYDELDGNLYRGPVPPFSGTVPMSVFRELLLSHRSYMLAVTVLIRAGILRSIGGFHQDGSPAAVDMATGMRLIDVPGEVVYVPAILGVWRHHPQQSTSLRAVELALFNSQIAIRYYDRLSVLEQQYMSIDRESIVKARRRQIADAYFGTLRVCLRQRNYQNARSLITGLWCYGGLKRRLQAIYAILAVLIGLDYEPVLNAAEALTRKQKNESRLSSTVNRGPSVTC